MLRHLDLFSGIGGFALGLERTGGFRTVAFCEADPFCRSVLRRHWPGVPIHPDVRELSGDATGPVDIVTGGYPCQPFSLAGKRRGAADDRHLWPEMHRLVDQLRPAWVLGENVAGHVTMGLDGVLSDLEALGYACRAFVVPACAVGAPHRRDRVWVVAHGAGARHGAGEGEAMAEARNQARGKRSERLCGGGGGGAVADARGAEPPDRNARPLRPGSAPADAERRGGAEPDSHPDRERQPQPQGRGAEVRRRAGDLGGDVSDAGRGRGEGPGRGVGGGAEPFGWDPEPDVGRVAHGVPQQVDRIKALGNAVVPQIPEAIGRAILAAEGK